MKLTLALALALGLFMASMSIMLAVERLHTLNAACSTGTRD